MRSNGASSGPLVNIELRPLHDPGGDKSISATNMPRQTPCRHRPPLGLGPAIRPRPCPLPRGPAASPIARKATPPRAPRGVRCRAVVQILGCGDLDQERESSERPMLNAFCRVAPSVRPNFLAILLAAVFLRAMVFRSRTSLVVQARRFFDRLAIKPPFQFNGGSLYPLREQKKSRQFGRESQSVQPSHRPQSRPANAGPVESSLLGPS